MDDDDKGQAPSSDPPSEEMACQRLAELERDPSAALTEQEFWRRVNAAGTSS